MINEGQKTLDAVTDRVRCNQSAVTIEVARHEVWEIDWLVKQLKKDLWRKGSELCMAVSDRMRDRDNYCRRMKVARDIIRLGREAMADPDLVADYEEQAREFLGEDEDG